MRWSLAWPPFVGAALGLIASFVWPWAAEDIACPARTAGQSCLVYPNLLAQHVAWTAIGLVAGLVVSFLLATFDGSRLEQTLAAGRQSIS